jgi:hypothetical protein
MMYAASPGRLETSWRHPVQEWLSFYFKSPQQALSGYPEHDLFIQQAKLENTLRWLMGEERCPV